MKHNYITLTVLFFAVCQHFLLLLPLSLLSRNEIDFTLWICFLGFCWAIIVRLYVVNIFSWATHVFIVSGILFGTVLGTLMIKPFIGTLNFIESLPFELFFSFGAGFFGSLSYLCGSVVSSIVKKMLTTSET